MFSRSSSSRHSKGSGRHGHSRSNDDHSRGGRSRDLVDYGGRGLGCRNSERIGWGRESPANLHESSLLRRSQDPMQDISQGLDGMQLGGLGRMGGGLRGGGFGGRGFESRGLESRGLGSGGFGRFGGPRSGLGGLGGSGGMTDMARMRGGIGGLRRMTDMGGMSGIGGLEQMEQVAFDPRLPYGLEQGYDVNDLMNQQQGLPPMYGDPSGHYDVGGPSMEGYPMPTGGGLGMMARRPGRSLTGGLRGGFSAGRKESLPRDPRVDLGSADLKGPGSPHLQPGRFGGGLRSPLHSPLRSPLRSTQPSLRDGQVMHQGLHQGPQQQSLHQGPTHQHPSASYRPPYVEEYEGWSDQDIRDIMSMGREDHHFWGPHYGDAGGYDGYGPLDQRGYLGPEEMEGGNDHH